MPTPKLRTTLVAGTAALALLAGACSTGGDDAADAGPTSAVADGGGGAMADMEDLHPLYEGDVNAATTPGADLRATLTALLEEHTYLAGIAVFSAANAPDAFDPAVAALDGNSQDLAAAVGSAYGDEAGAAFLEMWRTHIGFFVDYATARAAGDQAGQDAAREQLEVYFLDLADFLAGANPEFDADALVAGLQPHADTLLDTIDAVVDGDPDAFDELRAAGAHMSMIAEALAAGTVAQDPAAWIG